ncbi:MAG: DUF302 domain-containing protein [Desulfobacterales bacterium]
MTYYFSKFLNIPFQSAVTRVSEELKKEGFGILNDIDVKETLRKKLNVNVKRYRILGACHPEYAYRALKIENKIGTLLPCNVIVRENEEGRIEVAAVDPVASMQAVNNAALIDIAGEIQSKLKEVISRL